MEKYMNISEYPTKTLYKGRAQTLGMLLAAVLFTIGGGLMLADGESFGWVAIAFFGVLGVPTFVYLLLNPDRLILDSAGFVRYMFGRRDRLTEWTEIEKFRVVQEGRKQIVEVIFSSQDKNMEQHKSLKEMFATEAVVEQYGGLDANALAALMNKYREHQTNQGTRYE